MNSAISPSGSNPGANAPPQQPPVAAHATATSAVAAAPHHPHHPQAHAQRSQLQRRAEGDAGGIAAAVYQSEEKRRQQRLAAMRSSNRGDATARIEKRRVALGQRRRVLLLKLLAFAVLLLALLALLGSAMIVNLERWSRIAGTPVALNSAASWEESSPYSGYCYCESVSSSIGDLLLGASSSSSSSSAAASFATADSSSSSSSTSSLGTTAIVGGCAEAANSFEGIATLSLVLIGLEVLLLLVLLGEAAYYGRFGGPHSITRVLIALLLLASVTALLSFVAAYIVLLYEFCGMASFDAMGVRFGVAPWLRLLEGAVVLLLAVTSPLAFRSKQRGPQGFLLLSLAAVACLSVISTCSRSWFVFDQQRFIHGHGDGGGSSSNGGWGGGIGGSKSASVSPSVQSSAAGYAKGLGVAYVGPFAYLSRAARSALAPAAGSSTSDGVGGAAAVATTTTAAPLATTATSTTTAAPSSSSSSSSSSPTSVSAIVANLLRGITGTLTFLASPPPAAVRYFGVRDSCQCTHPCAPTIATSRFGLVKAAVGLFYHGGSSGGGSNNNRDASTNSLRFNQTARPTRAPWSTAGQPSAAAPVWLVGTAEDFSINAPLSQADSGGGSASPLLPATADDLRSGRAEAKSLVAGLVGNEGRIDPLASRAGVAFRSADDDVAWYLAWATAARCEAYVLSRVTAYLRGGGGGGGGGSASSSSSSAQTVALSAATDAALAADPLRSTHIITAAALAALYRVFPLPSTPYGAPYSVRNIFGGGGGSSGSEWLDVMEGSSLSASASSSSAGGTAGGSSSSSSSSSSSTSSSITASLALMLPVYPQYPFLWALSVLQLLVASVLFLFVILRIVDNRGASVVISQGIAVALLAVTATHFGLSIGLGPAASAFECTAMPNTSTAGAGQGGYQSSSSAGDSLSSSSSSASSGGGGSFSLSNTTIIALASIAMSSVPQTGNITVSSSSSSSSSTPNPTTRLPFSFSVREADYRTEKAFAPYYALYAQLALMALVALLCGLNSLYVGAAPKGYHDVAYRRLRFHSMWWDILQDCRALSQADRELAQLMKNDGSSSSSSSSSDGESSRHRRHQQQQKQLRRRRRSSGVAPAAAAAAAGGAGGSGGRAATPPIPKGRRRSSGGSRRAPASSSVRSSDSSTGESSGDEPLFKEQFFAPVNASHRDDGAGLRRRRT